ncbi:ABC-2 type transporter-domain-containing protein [Aspergillus parasiticus]|uniref:ABC-2 type transporter-domain-containing protein n=1 Tax=Aspergillus parasiticus TaxID=5067 RepID=A0A5N6DBM9_ASPPA|nr:ABC-2 type transporter-domain-containing protein [Aspergillus parasiticus]
MRPPTVPGRELLHSVPRLTENHSPMDSTDGESELAERVDDQINDLARRVTSISVARGGQILPKPTEDALDPNSPDFDTKKWVRAFYDNQTEALNGTPPNSAGLAFKDLSVFGQKAEAEYQRTVEDFVYGPLEAVRGLFGSRKQQRIDILQDLEGVMESGEMLCVLGPPGSGCSTFLKTIAGETYGFEVAGGSTLNYQGLGKVDIEKTFKGEAIYTAEVDYHFPKLTVGETLYFAARARCPQKLADSKHEYAEHLRDVVMAMLGISHTKNTRVGDDFIRGVSGGERKRVSIAEAILSYSPWQCWDNSTRGLDSANAVSFCRTLRLQSETFGSSVCVAIYQAPQEAYDLFDKVIVLYEGRQIFFGKTSEAKAYFEGLGFECPAQQTTPDFLTSMTSPSERIVKAGWEGKTPRSPEEFARAWRESQHRQSLINEIEAFETRFPIGGSQSEQFRVARTAQKSRSLRAASPFTLSLVNQFLLNLWRSYRLLIADPWFWVTLLFANFFESIVVASIFYNMPQDSSSMFRRNLLIFYGLMINVWTAALEILTLYSKRKIVEKHVRYALYHPSMEALASIAMDIPFKLVNAVCINVTLYFMCNLRREPGPFFFFYLLAFTITITMSMFFRFLASVTKTISQALAPCAIVILGLMLYGGFIIPQAYLDDWIGWLRWINPLFYVQESLSLSEFVGRKFSCVEFVPSGPSYATESIPPLGQVCSVEGSIAGEGFVDGSVHLRVMYGFIDNHRWRNFGILIGLTTFFLVIHLIAVELISSERSKGEILVYPRHVLKKHGPGGHDEEKMCSTSEVRSQERYIQTDEVKGIEKQTSIFHWQDVCYTIQIKKETQTILDHVDGWVKPGTLTALMGVSGAGKTTLLDVLASRVTMGVISGRMLVDGQPRDSSFQRKTGYVTQQDLNLHTSTVREALQFSALLRQPARYSRQEKLDYVNEVIRLVDLEDCADAVVGCTGEGLNVEQRKRLTIGVELAARPELLLFLDEPTSGLDSQTSWAICDLMEKLTRNGQAILCTIHQPSAALFQRFDRLLLLAKGGRTVYFGEVGKESSTLIDYFARNGAPQFKPGTNPAEYMLEVVGATSKHGSNIDWPAVWRAGPEYQDVRCELDRLSCQGQGRSADLDPAALAEFAASFPTQLVQVTKRVFQQYWRTPSYIFSKIILSAGSALFIGLSQVNGDVSQRGLFNQMLATYIFLFIFSQVVEQILPMFVSQRTLYEARERPAKAYSWVVFLTGNIIVELAWNSLMAIFSFLFWYFPMGLYRNAEWTDTVHSRGVATCLHLWIFFAFTSTFANMLIAGIETEQVAGGFLNFFFNVMFAFAGILAGPGELPGFWIFMYRVNPFTYVMESFLGTALADAPVTCTASELVHFEAPNGMSCGEYVAPYIVEKGGYLLDNSTSSCSFCGTANSNSFLADMNLSFDNRWRDFGFMWAFCVFNIAAAVGLYWLMRVPKRKARE